MIRRAATEDADAERVAALLRGIGQPEREAAARARAFARLALRYELEALSLPPREARDALAAAAEARAMASEAQHVAVA